MFINLIPFTHDYKMLSSCLCAASADSQESDSTTLSVRELSSQEIRMIVLCVWRAVQSAKVNDVGVMGLGEFQRSI